jgi:hypothetical protein
LLPRKIELSVRKEKENKRMAEKMRGLRRGFLSFHEQLNFQIAEMA